MKSEQQMNFLFLDDLQISSTNTVRSYSFDFLKLLATIAIAFHHFEQVNVVVYPQMINFISSWFYWGNLVELFFILSGFFVYKYVPAIQEGSITLSAWYIRRAKRLLPMVAISAVVFEIILGVYVLITGDGWLGLTVSLWGTVITAMGIQEGWVFVNPMINNPMWYISVLMGCYLVFYILTYTSKKLSCSPVYFYIFMVLLGCGIFTYGINRPMFNGLMARGYYSFFVGVLLSYYIHEYGVLRKTVMLCASVFVSMTFIFVMYPQYIADQQSYLLTFLMYPSMVILLQTRTARHIFKHKIWGILGQISFEAFVWHVPVILIMHTLTAANIWVFDYSKISTMYLFLLAVYIIAVLMFYFVEKPLDRMITKKLEEMKFRAQVRKVVLDQDVR